MSTFARSLCSLLTEHPLTIKATRHRIVILDNILIDEDTLGSVPNIDKDGVVGRVDRIDDESVWTRAEIK